MKLIGISGKAGVGKDTFRAKFYPTAFQWAFAWPLKMRALGMGWSHEEVFQTKPADVRQYLQREGMRERRDDPDYWVKQCFGWLQTLQNAGNFADRPVVITDVRFPNEADVIKRAGGKLIRLEYGERHPVLIGDAALHESETALDEYIGWGAIIESGANHRYSYIDYRGWDPLGPDGGHF